MTTVREINRIDDLAEFRHDWHRLWAQTPLASFFHTLDWLEVYWRHYAADQKLRVLIVSDARQPIGVLPLVVTTERTRVGPVRVLTYPLHDWGDTYGPIGPNPAITLAAGLEHIRRTRRDWDLLEFRWLPSDSDTTTTQQAMRGAGFQAYQTVWTHTAVIDLAGTWDDYLAGRHSKWRNNLNRWERRLRERGEIEFVRYRPVGSAQHDDDPRWDLYDACEELARRSWQGSSTTGTTLSHESVRPFLRESHVAAVRAGLLDLNLLFLGGTPVAYAYNYHCGGLVYGLRIGYDPEFRQAGAGNCLYARAIRDSFARGDRLYDLGPGSFDAKRYYWSRILPILRFSHFPTLAIRAQLLRMKRWAQTTFPILGADVSPTFDAAAVAADNP
jgi:CelD/BcsL family acetyltransferase involved in cellulose biosynthesis